MKFSLNLKTVFIPFIAGAFSFASFNAHAVKITLSCGGVGAEFDICKMNAQAWAKETGNEVKLFQTPSTSNDRLAMMQQFFAAKSAEIDVIQVDVVWPGPLGQHFLDLKDYLPAAHINNHFKAILENNTDANGHLVAMPLFTDAGLLYYRKDLLKKYNHAVPNTWAELKATTLDILEKEKKTNPKLQGFVWQGRAYEGLTCNALEWISSFNGGTVVDNKTGDITVNNPKAIAALNEVASWIDTISPKAVLTYDEEGSRRVFQDGEAIFMRNWPYAWSLLNGDKSSVKGNVGVAPLPMVGNDGRHVGTLGGWNLSVSKYSKHPKEAADLVRYMTTQKMQKTRALQGSFNPTIQALYQDESLTQTNPFYKDLFDVFMNAVARPSIVTGKSYSKVSSSFWTSVHAVIAGEEKADKAMASLEKDLQAIKKNGWSK